MKTILLPTDFSENARHAVSYAFTLFGDTARYILLNMYEEPHTRADMMYSIGNLLQEDSLLGLKEEVEWIKENYPSYDKRVETKSEFGLLRAVVNRIVKDEKVDFLVMGTRGATGLKKVLIGSTTSAVIRKASCPVIAVPLNAEISSPSRIAFASDYNEVDERILSPLVDLIHHTKTEALVVNIQTELEASPGKEVSLHPVLDQAPHHVYSQEGNGVVQGINSFINHHRISLLAMVARKHSFFDRLVHQSTTEEVSMGTSIPLLVLHEE